MAESLPQPETDACGLLFPKVIQSLFFPKTPLELGSRLDFGVQGSLSEIVRMRCDLDIGR